MVYARAGRVVAELDGQFPEDRSGEDPNALDGELADLVDTASDVDASDEWQAAMLAVVERRTGWL